MKEYPTSTSNPLRLEPKNALANKNYVTTKCNSNQKFQSHRFFGKTAGNEVSTLHTYILHASMSASHTENPGNEMKRLAGITDDSSWDISADQLNQKLEKNLKAHKIQFLESQFQEFTKTASGN